MNLRKPETQADYEQFKQTYAGTCPFCDAAVRNPSQIVKVHSTMKILRNDFPYSKWDNFDVADHLMIVPARHIGSFDEFNEREAQDFFQLLREYESAHYSVYSRAPSSLARTQSHLHTHLIKPTGY